ncbi:hypothetical protein H671_8g19176 [Cricetulus griseus]|nr:hypothetical protein H671_8g19176 [Cricetulus griseus]
MYVTHKAHSECEWGVGIREAWPASLVELVFAHNIYIQGPCGFQQGTQGILRWSFAACQKVFPGNSESDAELSPQCCQQLQLQQQLQQQLQDQQQLMQCWCLLNSSSSSCCDSDKGSRRSINPTTTTKAGNNASCSNSISSGNTINNTVSANNNSSSISSDNHNTTHTSSGNGPPCQIEDLGRCFTGFICGLETEFCTNGRECSVSLHPGPRCYGWNPGPASVIF